MFKLISNKNTYVFIYFLCLVLTGYLLHKDFGITSDEPWLRELGLITMNYVGEVLNIQSFKTEIDSTLPVLKNYSDGDHGAIFEIFSIVLEKIIGIEQERDIYIFKHFLVFVVFCFGVYAMYLMATRRYNSWRIGLLTATLLILSPRFFAESFYNSKDIIFMVLFAMSMNTMISFLKENTFKSASLHAITTAAAFDMRIAGIAFPILTAFFITVQLVRNPRDKKSLLINTCSYFMLLMILIPLMWPWLWIDLPGNLKQAFINMAYFQRLIVWVLYRGHYYVTSGLPWHYIPTYIAITTPIVYLVFFIIGSAKIISQIIRCKLKLWETDQQLQDLVFFGLFFGPVILVIILKSVLYNGWRHLYFVYPAFLMIAVRGFVYIYSFSIRKNITKKIAISVLTFSIITTTNWMVKNHPLNNTYFNILAGKNWKNSFHVDYWGLSTYLALKYILSKDKREEILIKPLQCINIHVSMILLTAKERSRIKLVFDNTLSDYMLLNYQFIDPEQNKIWNEIRLNYAVYHDIKVDDEVVISIIKENQLINRTTPVNNYGFKTC